MSLRPIKVNVSSIDIRPTFPYQWAVLKTYASEIEEVDQNVTWGHPLYFTLFEAEEFFKNEEDLISRFELDRLDVLGLSCYVWNSHCQMKLARLVKKYNPQCLIVAGGPDIDFNKPDIFQKLPSVDIIVKNDGEIPFRKILLNVIQQQTSFYNVPGLVVTKDGKHFDTGPIEVIQQFDRSPWLENQSCMETVGKDLVGRYKYVYLTYETNRGCPYSCTFCNWGSNTNSKIRCFDLKNIEKEIDWLKTLELHELFLSDANLGLLPRDLQIADWMCRLRESKSPPNISINPAKKTLGRAVEVGIKLYKAGILKYFPIGIQSTDPNTLQAIGRINLKVTEHQKVVEALKKESVPMIVQIILGCPGDTFDAWKTSISDMYEIGVEQFHLFKFQILKNTPADLPSYREKWKIETAKRSLSDGTEEEYIVSTSTFTKEDLIEMDLFFLVTHLLWQIPAVRKVYQILKDRDQLRYKSFFETLFDDLFNSEKYEVLFEALCSLRNHMRKNLVENGTLYFSEKMVRKAGDGDQFYGCDYFLLKRIGLEESETLEASLKHFFRTRFDILSDEDLGSSLTEIRDKQLEDHIQLFKRPSLVYFTIQGN